MVYGLAQQSGGTVVINSTVGVGTTVELYLSRSAGDQSDAVREEAATVDLAVRARILLVDDDAEVRSVTAAYLNDMGHRVVEAADGASALDILRAEADLDLLIADFAMPGMTGLDLADKARKQQPDLGILLVTGYADPERMPDNYPVLQKPFSRVELSSKVMEAARRVEASEYPRP
jgi:CheY-like chemotaxis protein